jgi:hypothetical protein
VGGLTVVPSDSLWWLVAPVAVWTAHFGGVYGLVALGCPRLAEGLVHGGVAGVTLAAMGALFALGWRGWRRHARGAQLGEDLAASRYRFLGLVTAMLSATGALGVLYEAASVALVGGCS